MKQILLPLSLLFIFVGCAPKMGKIQAMEEYESNRTAEIFIMRNYNFFGSAIRLYPTINDKKIVGLYTKNHVRFYLKEGKYNFGVKIPDVVFGTWAKSNTIEKVIEANKKYYFLLSLNIIGMEIEEISQKEGEKRMGTSKLIKTGSLSFSPDSVVKTIRPISDFMGLNEDDGRK